MLIVGLLFGATDTDRLSCEYLANVAKTKLNIRSKVIPFPTHVVYCKCELVSVVGLYQSSDCGFSSHDFALLHSTETPDSWTVETGCQSALLWIFTKIIHTNVIDAENSSLRHVGLQLTHVIDVTATTRAWSKHVIPVATHIRVRTG